MLAPSMLYLSQLPRFGRCQYNDYYGIIAQVTDGTRITRDPVRWLKLKSNEHTVTIPALIYAANMRLTHGDNRGLSAFALGLLFLSFALLYRLFLPTLDLPPPARWGAGFLLTAYLFSPVSAHSVVMGFSGTIWFLANLFTVAAVGLFVLEPNGEPAHLAPVLVLGLLGALSYSTNLSLWPALLAAGLLLRRPLRQLVAVALTGAAVYVVFFHFFRPLPWHPRPETSHPLVVAAYGATYLGNLFSAHPLRAAIVGALGGLLAAGLVVRLLSFGSSNLRRSLAPWVALQVYVIGNALGTAVGRAGLGMTSALASRYSSLTTLFWIAVLAELFLVLRQGWAFPPPRLRPRAALLVSGGLAAILLIPVFHHGLPIYRAYLVNAGRQPLAAEAVRRGIRDIEVLRVLTPAPEQIAWVWGFLKANRQAPFDRPLPPPPAHATILPAATPGVRGRIEGLKHIAGGVWRVQGWAVAGGRRPPNVVVADAKLQPLSPMVGGLPHAPIPGLTRRLSARAGWGGCVTVSSRPQQLRGAVILPGPSLVPFGEIRTAPPESP